MLERYCLQHREHISTCQNLAFSIYQQYTRNIRAESNFISMSVAILLRKRSDRFALSYFSAGVAVVKQLIFLI